MAAQSDGTVEDPDKLNQRQKLREIHEARQRVTEVRGRAGEAQVFQGIQRDQGNGLYRRALENYVIQLLPIMRSDDFDPDADELLDERDFGSVVCRHGDQQQRTELTGLKCLFELPTPLVFEFAEKDRSDRTVSASNTIRRRKEIPQRFLDEMLIACDEYRQEVGLGLDASHGTEQITAQAPDALEDVI